MDELLRRKYQALLLVLILLLVLYPLLREVFQVRLLFDGLLTLLFLTALLGIFTRKYPRLLAFVLGVPTLVGVWSGYVLPGLPRLPTVLGFHAFAALFFVVTVGAILRAIFEEETVSRESICGAFCGYLLLGLLFGHLYCLLESLLPGSFRGREELPTLLQEEGRLQYLLSYFSFVTLTTAGFGDITPARDAARGLAVVEAVVGQFYLAVLVATLIGKRVSQLPTSPAGNSSPDPPVEPRHGRKSHRQ